MNNKWYRYLATVAVICGFFLVIQPASASVAGTLDVGSSGTVTATLTSITFNNDPAAIGGSNFTCPPNSTTCDADVASGTNLTFSGGPLTTQEGIDVKPLSLTTTLPLNNYMTFSNNANLDFSLASIPSITNTNCAALTAGQSCVIATGEVLGLTLNANGTTTVTLDLGGTATDGTPGSSNWTGDFTETITANLPNGTAPTPANIQAYFCGTQTSYTVMNCATYEAGLGTAPSITSSSPEAGQFTATFTSTPEPGTMTTMLLGSGLVLLALRRKARASR